MKRSLRKIFFRRLTLLTIFSALLLGILLVRAERTILLNDLANKGEAIARILAAVTLDAVMVHDYATVERYAADIVQDPTIIFLLIKRVDGEILASHGDGSRQDHVLSITHPVTIGKEIFGEVHIVFSTMRGFCWSGRSAPSCLMIWPTKVRPSPASWPRSPSMR